MTLSARKKKKLKDGGQKQQSAPVPVKPELQVDPKARHPAMTVEFTFKVKLQVHKVISNLILIFNHVKAFAMIHTVLFQALSSCLQKLTEDELKCFRKLLWERYPEIFRDPLEGLDVVNLVDKILELCDLEVSLNITLVLLKSMSLKRLAEYLEGLRKRSTLHSFVFPKTTFSDCCKACRFCFQQLKCDTS